MAHSEPNQAILNRTIGVSTGIVVVGLVLIIGVGVTGPA
jgi:hypothetical protein